MVKDHTFFMQQSSKLHRENATDKGVSKYVTKVLQIHYSAIKNVINLCIFMEKIDFFI